MMVITRRLSRRCRARQWKWDWRRRSVFGLFLVVDLTSLPPNALKIVEGGWLPLAVAAGVFILMETWRAGRRVLWKRPMAAALSTELFLERADKTPLRVAGTAIFITPRLDEVPGALLAQSQAQ